MKHALILFFFGLITLSCNTKSGNHMNHGNDKMPSNNPNQALYEEVMDIHNEVMPKTGSIYDLRTNLKDKIDKTPDLTADKKKELEAIVHELDSAQHSMDVWMRKFKYYPEADTVDTEASREYLENEMEKIKQVRDLINGSIQKAKDEVGKK